MVVEIRLSQKRPRCALALVVKNEADDLVHVDRHGERAAHPRVVERRAAQVVADVGIAVGDAREALVARVVREALHRQGCTP